MFTLFFWIFMILWTIVGAAAFFAYETEDPVYKQISKYSLKQQLYTVFKCGPIAWAWGIDRYIFGQLK